MNRDKKLRLLTVPLIFTMLLYVPGMILDIASECMNVNILGSPEVIGYPYVIMLSIAMLICGILFYYIPIGVYIVILVVYTVVSWTWILRQKKGSPMYFIVWSVLCVLLF